MISLRGYSSDPRRLGKPADQCKVSEFEEECTVFTRPNAAMSPSLVKEKVYDGYEFKANLIAHDVYSDLAILDVEYPDFYEIKQR